ncbi:hypothetical protein N665_3201s0003 [Sinapis alba]|nr:hypothetical protein N665_3201s0003 [Sinapis alba]
MAEPFVADSFYNSSFDLDVDFELTFDDLYFPSENESFFLPVDATNLESSEATIASSSSSKVVDDQKFKVEEEAATTTCKTNKTKRKREEDRSMSGKYMRLDDEKRDARLIRNRESALLSRQRKKHYVEELEDKVKNLQTIITDLNSKVSYFMSENVTLRQTVGSGKGMCWPPSSGMYPMPYPWMPFPAYLGSHQVVPLLPIPRLKPQRSLAKVKKSSEAKTKKVASVSFLGLLFCLFLFCALAPIVNVSYGGRVLDVSVNSSRRVQCGRALNCVHLTPQGPGICLSTFIPKSGKLCHLLALMTLKTNSTRQQPMVKCSNGFVKVLQLNCLHLRTITPIFVSMYPLLGPMFSSEMCTEVFQFDVSSTSGAIRPASQQPKNTTDTHKGNNNRRILRGGQPVSDFNLTKDQNSSSKENFSTTKPFPSMVASVLTDPREDGGDGDIDGTHSLSRVFIVVLVDGVKYVTYSCVLPRAEEVPHLVTT